MVKTDAEYELFLPFEATKRDKYVRLALDGAVLSMVLSSAASTAEREPSLP
jgi:hypothetical protein